MSQSRGAGKCAEYVKKDSSVLGQRITVSSVCPASFYYCSQVWHHCGSRNTKKIEKVNERALRYVYRDKTSAYHELLQRIGLGTTLENRRVQDMLITINSCFQGTGPTCIKELVKMRNNKYDLRGNNTLSLPKVNTTKHGLNSFRYFAAKQSEQYPKWIALKSWRSRI